MYLHLIGRYYLFPKMKKLNENEQIYFYLVRYIKVCKINNKEVEKIKRSETLFESYFTKYRLKKSLAMRELYDIKKLPLHGTESST